MIIRQGYRNGIFMGKKFEKGLIPWSKGKHLITKGSFKKGHKRGMTGKHHSEETKRKISFAHRSCNSRKHTKTEKEYKQNKVFDGIN